MKKFTAILAICVFGFFGCASLGVWSTTAQSDITAFQAWADQWVSGALAEAPAIIAAAASLPGVNPTITKVANDAVAAAQGAVSVLHAIGAGASANTQAATEASIVAAINNVSATVGAVQATIAAASPTAAAPAVAVPVVAATPAAK